MSFFVSYAQNFEDVMLWRALQHIPFGTYVDVGAQDPVVDSVSRAFYERGWRGIHIEPVRMYADRLRANRPDETVLEVALGESPGTMELHVIGDTGLSTAVEAHAQRHHAERGLDSTTVQVPVLTLASALKSLEGKEVHWLKIDVEGFEAQVVRGWDSKKLRPWVLVIEATIPGSAKPDFAAWDPIIQAADYRFVYFDGLNRFYVAREHSELVEKFSVPPNVFDNVRLSGLSGEWCAGLIIEGRERDAQLQARIDEGEVTYAKQRALISERDALLTERNTQIAKQGAELAEQETRLAEQETRLTKQETQLANQASKLAVLEIQVSKQAAELLERASALTDFASREQLLVDRVLAEEQIVAELKQHLSDATRIGQHLDGQARFLQREVEALHSSTSWRITAPMRVAVRAVRFVGTYEPNWLKVRFLQTVRPITLGSMRLAMSNHVLRVTTLALLSVHPPTKQRLRSLAIKAGLIQVKNSTANNSATQSLVGSAGINHSESFATINGDSVHSPDFDGDRSHATISDSVATLSPTAERTFLRLQRAIQQGKY